MKNNKKISISIIVLIVSMFLIVGATFAWFTSSVSNTNNKIVAGTLDIKLERKGDDDYEEIEDGSDTKLFDYDKWEPGYSSAEILKVSNAGNLAFKYKLTIVPDSNEDDDLKLAEVIDVYALISDEDISVPESIDAAITAGYTKVGTLKDVLTSEDTDGFAYGVLLPEDSTAKNTNEVVKEVYVGVILHMSEDAGNEYQGAQVGGENGFNIQLDAIQYTFEEDGFGSDQYDIGASKETMYIYFIDYGDALENINSQINLKINGDSYTLDINTEFGTATEEAITPITFKKGDVLSFNFGQYSRPVKIFTFKPGATNMQENQITTSGYVSEYEYEITDDSVCYLIIVDPATM